MDGFCGWVRAWGRKNVFPPPYSANQLASPQWGALFLGPAEACSFIYTGQYNISMTDPLPPFSPFSFIHRWKIYIFLHFNRLCQLKFTRDDFLYKIIIKYLRFVSLFSVLRSQNYFFFGSESTFPPSLGSSSSHIFPLKNVPVITAVP